MSDDVVKEAFERFWESVEVGRPNDCWEWQLTPDGDGYGQFKMLGLAWRAHRVAWSFEHGPLERDAVIRHTCDNPMCCNPMHLELGTHAENRADTVARGKQAKGEKNGRAKLTDEDVYYVRLRWDERKHGDVAFLARLYLVDPKAIRNIGQRKTWKHLPERPKYLGGVWVV